MERAYTYDQSETIQPITPEEASEVKLETIPSQVIETVNRLVVVAIHRGRATILQEDIVKALVQSGFKRREIYEKGWLNFEDIYRNAGWDVKYDKPGWNESYEANFTFTQSQRRKLGGAASRQYQCEQQDV